MYILRLLNTGVPSCRCFALGAQDEPAHAVHGIPQPLPARVRPACSFFDPMRGAAIVDYGGIGNLRTLSCMFEDVFPKS